MRAIATFALAAGVAVSALAISPAEAQQRRAPLSVTVEGRSWLDAGRAAPQGSYNRHLGAANRAGFTPPNMNSAAFSGFSSLPDHIGGGVNPFANTIWTPTFR